jgi:hypothetical protein
MSDHECKQQSDRERERPHRAHAKPRPEPVPFEGYTNAKVEIWVVCVMLVVFSSAMAAYKLPAPSEDEWPVVKSMRIAAFNTTWLAVHTIHLVLALIPALGPPVVLVGTGAWFAVRACRKA